MKPIILLDIDDTLSDFNKAFWELHNKLYNTDVKPQDVVDWDFSNFSFLGNDVYKLLKYPNLYRDLPLKPYAKELVSNLQSKYEVYLVTDSPRGITNSEAEALNLPFSNPTDDKKLWVSENFPNFPKERIIFTSEKELLRGDVIVDDKPSTIEAFINKERNHILIDMPYNSEVATPYRAHSLEEVEVMIDSIMEKR